MLFLMAPYTLTKISDIFYFSCWTTITNNREKSWNIRGGRGDEKIEGSLHSAMIGYERTVGRECVQWLQFVSDRDVQIAAQSVLESHTQEPARRQFP